MLNLTELEEQLNVVLFEELMDSLSEWRLEKKENSESETIKRIKNKSKLGSIPESTWAETIYYKKNGQKS